MSAKVDALALKNRMELFGPEVGEYIFRLESKVSALESTLARERKSRKQAEDVIAKARCIRHWHDWGRNDEGMVVSAPHVHELWESLAKLDALAIPQEPAEPESGK